MQPLDRFAAQVLIGDHLARIHAFCRQRAGPAYRAEINGMIAANRLANLAAALSLADHCRKPAVKQGRGVNIHPPGGGRPAAANGKPCGRRRRPGVINNRPLQRKGERFPLLQRLRHPSVRGVTRSIGCAGEQHPVARAQGSSGFF